MLRIGVIGAGKIARDRHLPSIAASADFQLAGLADPAGGEGVHPDHASLFAATPGLDAVAICTPPRQRFAVACDALRAGKHVLLEKPPAAGLGELAALTRLAAARGLTLFTAWHSQHNIAVQRAAGMLEGRQLARLQVTWHEDVRKYHPGQAWIWQEGGFGVFDAGINALSILARILPGQLALRDATLHIPQGCATPILASLDFGPGRTASLDWRGQGPELRQIEIDTECGRRLRLLQSGGRLECDGEEIPCGARAEYPMLYAHFAALIDAGRSEVDGEPLQMLADAFLLGRRLDTDPITGGPDGSSP